LNSHSDECLPVAIEFHCDLSARSALAVVLAESFILPDGLDEGSNCCGWGLAGTVSESACFDGGAGLLLRDRPRTRSVIAPKNEREVGDIEPVDVREDDMVDEKGGVVGFAVGAFCGKIVGAGAFTKDTLEGTR